MKNVVNQPVAGTTETYKVVTLKSEIIRSINEHSTMTVKEEVKNDAEEEQL